MKKKKIMSSDASFNRSSLYPQDQYRSVFSSLMAQANRIPESVAIAAPGRPPLTYRKLCNHIYDVVETLNKMGLGRNDRIAIVLPNGPEMAVAFLAVTSCATSAPLNPAFREAEFYFYLSDLNARALMILPEFAAPAIAAARSIGIPVIDLLPAEESEAGLFYLEGNVDLNLTLGGIAQSDDVALVLHTSGTTSRPKIVPLTQRNLCESANNHRATLKLKENDCCLNVMPLFHIHGLVSAVLSSEMAGASVVCTPGPDMSKFFEWLTAFSPTWYTASPTIHQKILEHASCTQNAISKRPLRFIRSAAAPLPSQVMAELELVFNTTVVESYGMTEAAAQITSNLLPPGERKPGSVGVAAGPKVAIMDEAGDLLPQGQSGEIVIRGANVTSGYENNPTANDNAFTNGWFRTGDQGYFDAENYLFITGRLKEIINRGGEKIAPREIDEALLEHPAVAQAIAFAVAHPTLNEDVAAAVVLRNEACVTEKELREFAFSRLADYKVPSQVVIVDEIPKGPTGKLQRIGLGKKLRPQLKSEFVPPRNSVEERLAGLWAEVLKLEQIGIYDNFFMLGGDSLLATQLVARIRMAFQLELALRIIFEKPTVAGISNYIAAALLILPDPRHRGEISASDREEFEL